MVLDSGEGGDRDGAILAGVEAVRSLAHPAAALRREMACIGGKGGIVLPAPVAGHLWNSYLAEKRDTS